MKIHMQPSITLAGEYFHTYTHAHTHIYIYIYIDRNNTEKDGDPCCNETHAGDAH